MAATGPAGRRATTERGGGIVVLGVGNVLFGDDGLGVRAVEALRARGVTAGARVIDGGVLGLELLPIVESADVLILVDAVDAQAPAGSLVRLEGRDIESCLARADSPHDLGLTEVLALAAVRGTAPEGIVLVGLVPDRVAPGDELSPAVRAGIEDLLDAVESEIAAAGGRRRGGAGDNGRAGVGGP